MLEKRLRRRHPLLQIIWDNWFIIVVFVFLWRFPYLVASWTGSEVDPESPRIASESKFWQAVMIELFILSMLAISYNLMFGYTGVISFGHGLFFGTGAYTVAVLFTRYGISLTTSILTAILLGVVYGLIWAMASFRVKGVYFAMFTLAFAEIFYQLSRLTLFDFMTRGDDGLTWTTPDWISPIKNRLQLYNLALAALIFSFLMVRRLMTSPSGKVLLALRENESRAQTLGFNVYMYKTLAIVVSSAIATMAGVFHVILNRQATPNSLGLDRTVDPLIMTLIGGTGTLTGPLTGSTMLRIGQEYFKKPELQVDIRFIIGRYATTVNSERYWALALGLAFIIFVMLVPHGVVGSVNLIWFDIRRWVRRFIYNPLVRSNSWLARWMEPVTGESPEFAQAIAENDNSPSIPEWARSHPETALNGLIFFIMILIIVVGYFLIGIGKLTDAEMGWHWRRDIEWALFFIVISIPLRLLLRIYRFFVLPPEAQDTLE